MGRKGHHQPHAWFRDTQLGRNWQLPASPWRARGLGSPSCVPTFKTSAWEMGPPKHLALKVNRACIHSTHKAVLNSESNLKGFHRIIMADPQGHSTGKRLKPTFSMKETKSKALWRRGEQTGAIFAFSPCLAVGHWYFPERSLCMPLVWSCHPRDTPWSPGSGGQWGLCSQIQ